MTQPYGQFQYEIYLQGMTGETPDFPYVLGRPYIWGLGVAGEDGVNKVLRSFLADLDLTLALSGYANLSEVDETLLTTTSKEP